MLLSRDEFIITLFRETDRAQRMKTPLSLILCGVAEWDRRTSALEKPKLVTLQQELTDRMTRALRCYDTAVLCGSGLFGVVLPGCSSFSAVAKAEQLRSAMFASPLHVGGEEVFLSGCFGVAGSGGRSPLVVLRNAEDALQKAKALGPGSIQRSSYDAEADPATIAVCCW